MRILITGGTGLVGTPLVQALIARKYQVVVLSRSPQKVYSRFCSAAENLNSLNDITHLNDIDAVINLAGEPIADKRWSEEQKKLLCESRWQITERLSELINASETPPAVFLSGSAVGWYGDQGQSVVTEDDEPNQEFTHTLCDRWESLAMKAQSEKTRVCLLRTGIVLSRKAARWQNCCRCTAPVLAVLLVMAVSICRGSISVTWSAPFCFCSTIPHRTARSI